MSLLLPTGSPMYDIKEVLQPAGDPGRQSLLDELNDFRKLMLIYRLIHFVCVRLSVSENPIKTISDHGKGQN